MYNNDKNKYIGARKLSFHIICIEMLLQFIILFYVNSTILTKYILCVLFFLSTFLCVIEIKKINIINLMLTTMIVLLMILSTFSGSGGWGAVINAIILIINLLVVSQMKFSYNQIRIVSYIYIIFFAILIYYSDRIYTYYINTNIFNFILNPNIIAYLALLNCFFAFYLIQNKRYIIKFLIVFIFTLYLLIETGARTSLVAFFVFVFLHLFNKRKQLPKIRFKKYKFWVCFIIVVSFFVIYIYAFLLPNYFSGDKLVLLNKNIFTGRQIIWQEIFYLMKHNWLFGVGADYAFTNKEFYSAHNFFLGYAATFGLPVMIGIIILLYRILRDCFLKNNNINTNYIFHIWIVLLIVSMFETVLSYSPTIVFSTSVFIFNLDSRNRGGNQIDT